LLATAALAAVPCAPVDRPGAILDADIAPDGSAYVLVHDARQACWWVVDEDGISSVAARFDPAARPAAIEALPDGRALLAMLDGRLVVRARTGEHTTLPVKMPSVPVVMVAHPELPLVALEFTIDAATTRVWLLDAAAGKLLGMVAVPAPTAALHFELGRGALFLDAPVPLVMDERGIHLRSRWRP
jgi:hypothetical protein